MSNGAPCGACKFLRRKCVNNCIFAPHFNSEQGAARFAAVHKIFGASNVTKLLHHIPMSKRSDAVVTICYEAQARLSDPIYGCVATIVTLQHQVASLQGELVNVQMQLSKCVASLQQQQQQQHQDSSSVYEQVFHNPALSSALALGEVPSSAATGGGFSGQHQYRAAKESDFCGTSSPPALVSVSTSSQHHSNNPQGLLKGNRISLEEDETQQLQQFWPGTGNSPSA